VSYSQSLERLQRILNELREKCPWDKKQTIASLRIQTIEELYELADAISEENWQNIKEELGDLLLHIAFYSKIAEEQNRFSFKEVIEGICNKLVARHPHIYDTVVVNNESDVKRNWEKLKLKEGKVSVLSGVPHSLPALVKSIRLQEKAAQVGFEWDQVSEVEAKIKEEWRELQEAMEQKEQKNVEEEFGDLLFSLMNYARYLKIDPENALEKTNKKFKYRFQEIEKAASASGKDLKNMSLEEMDALWNQAKTSNKNRNLGE
jgi:XTP/dITP diphosphohydrolase